MKKKSKARFNTTHDRLYIWRKSHESSHIGLYSLTMTTTTTTNPMYTSVLKYICHIFVHKPTSNLFLVSLGTQVYKTTLYFKFSQAKRFSSIA